MRKKLRRIMCIFGRHKISPFVEYEVYGVRFKECAVCGKILKAQNVKFGTILQTKGV